jgi:hypothetical protein
LRYSSTVCLYTLRSGAHDVTLLSSETNVVTVGSVAQRPDDHVVELNGERNAQLVRDSTRDGTIKHVWKPTIPS